ncbi:MAG: D-hexose-6-phosphate mutarotase [Pseudomonadota bacterium]|nr:D-hexose-6-phosphate mutarotase [Pseudomonadota bacterium]
MENQTVILCQIDELPCIRIQHPKATALVALQGAQLLEYTPTGDKPIIWLSPLAEFKRGKSVRGGIPVCWPWFGDPRRNPSAVQQHLPAGTLPAHGWVRDKPWVLDSVASNEDGVTLRFQFPTNNWPAPFPNGVELSLEMVIGSELQLTLTTKNSSDQTLHFSQALHSYFAISDVNQMEIGQLEGVTFMDTLDDWREKTEDTPIQIGQETDRIYVDTPELIVVRDRQWNREIQVSSSTAKSAVVWNPWIEKGLRLSQFGEESYREMVCVETASVMGNTVSIIRNSMFNLILIISNSR